MNSFLKYLVVFVAGAATFVLVFFGWSYFYFYSGDFEMESDPVFDQEMAMDSMREILIDVENYKQIFGFYPESLDDALGTYTSNYDPSIQHCECPYSFIYVRDDFGMAYNLQSRGADCEPFTDDDTFPRLSPSESINAGLLLAEVEREYIAPGGCGG